jgi:hypothetical protein
MDTSTLNTPGRLAVAALSLRRGSYHEARKIGTL